MSYQKEWHRDKYGRFCKVPPIIQPPEEILVDDALQFAMDVQFNYTGEQAVICHHFGCGKTLSPRERLFGNNCISHQKPESFPSIIDPYISQ